MKKRISILFKGFELEKKLIAINMRNCNKHLKKK